MRNKKQIWLIAGVVFLIILRLLYGLSSWFKYRSASKSETKIGTEGAYHLKVDTLLLNAKKQDSVFVIH